MNDKQTESFERRTRELFDREVADLDAATRSKLNQARQRALSELDGPSSVFGFPLPKAALAAVVVAAFGGWLFIRGGPAPDEEVSPDFAAATDLEIMLAEDELEFLEEIEFYAWLEAQPEFEGLADTVDGAG
jgi:hypothetical protein